jgi:hypothetical protein
MALRLRRGTDAQRAATTPADGELIWTTDTQELYVGGIDADTELPIVGGIRITGSQNDSPETLTRDLDMDGNVLFGTGTINIQGNITTNATVTANALVGDGSGIYNLRAANLDTSDLVVEGGAYNISVVSDDSTTLLDATNETLSVTGVTTNTLTSNTIVANEVVSNFVGSLYADDSSTIVDGLTGNIFTDRITSSDLKFQRSDENINLVEVTGFSAQAGFSITNRQSTDPGDYDFLGRVNFDFLDTDTNTRTTMNLISASPYGLFFNNDATGAMPNDNLMTLHNGNLLIGGFSGADERLIVADGTIQITNPNNNGSGGIKFGPTLQSEVGAGVEGQMYYDGGQHRMHIVNNTTTTVVLTQPFDSPVLEQATPTRFKNLTQAVIDSPTYAAAALNGSTFFNTDTNTLETYKNNQWNAIISQGDTFTGDLNGSVNLDDSTNIIAGDTGAITAPSYIQFGSFTTTERDALTAANGMVIYNTTDNKFQGYENGAWANLI